MENIKIDLGFPELLILELVEAQNRETSHTACNVTATSYMYILLH